MTIPDKETFKIREKVNDPSGVLSEATRHTYFGVDPTIETDSAEYTKLINAASVATAPFLGLELFSSTARRPGSNTIAITEVWKENSYDNEEINRGSSATFRVGDTLDLINVTAIKTLDPTIDNVESVATDNWYGIVARGTCNMTGIGPYTLSSVTVTNPGYKTSDPTGSLGAHGYYLNGGSGTLSPIGVANNGGTATLTPTINNGLVTSVGVTGSSSTFTATATFVIPYAVTPLFTDTRISEMRMRRQNKYKYYMTVSRQGIESPAVCETLTFEGQVYMKREYDSGSSSWKAYVYVAACYQQSSAGGTYYTIYLTPQLVHWPYRKIRLRKNLYTARVFTSNWTPYTVAGGDAGSDFSQYIGGVNSTVTSFTKFPAGTLRYNGAKCPEADIKWEGTIVRSAMMEYEFEWNPRHFVNPVGWRSQIEGVDSNVGVGWVDISTITVGGVNILNATMPSYAAGGPFDFM